VKNQIIGKGDFGRYVEFLSNGLINTKLQLKETQLIAWMVLEALK
jgi:hypothetical protein